MEISDKVQAIESIRQIKRIMDENSGKTLDEFAKIFGGFNCDGDLFDFNYGNLCATIRDIKGTPTLLDMYDVYDMRENLIAQNVSLDEIRKLGAAERIFDDACRVHADIEKKAIMSPVNETRKTLKRCSEILQEMSMMCFGVPIEKLKDLNDV